MRSPYDERMVPTMIPYTLATEARPITSDTWLISTLAAEPVPGPGPELLDALVSGALALAS